MPNFPQTEDIIENGKVTGMSASDVQKILNLKHAWEFVLDKDVISYPTDYPILCHIAKLVNEGFYQDGGRIRGGVTSEKIQPQLPVDPALLYCLMNHIIRHTCPYEKRRLRVVAAHVFPYERRIRIGIAVSA